MALGLSLGLTLSARAGGGAEPAPPFDPASIFASATGGFEYDFSDVSTLFTDLAGTTPVTASLDPIGYVADRSGFGNHRAAPFTSARPTYTEGGGLAWAAMAAGGGTRLELISAASGLTSVDDLTLMVGYTTHADAASPPITMGSTGSGNYAQVTNRIAISSYRYGTLSQLTVNNLSAADTSGASRVVTVMKRGSEGLHYVDGTLVETDTGLGTWAVDLSTSGAAAAIRGSASRIYYIAAVNKSLSDTVLSDWHEYVKAKAGIA